MYGLQSFALLLSLFTLTQAVTVARVCQSSQPYAPNSVDCKDAAKNIQSKYGDKIVQAGLYSSCEIIYSYQTCRVNLCAFPNQSLKTSDVVAAVSDVLSNCNTPSGGAINTGGYNIIQGTNFTVGISSTRYPIQWKCLATSTSSPLLNDCVKAYSSIGDTVNVTQSNASGCTTVARSGTCAVNYCDKRSSQISGAELKTYVGAMLFICNTDSAKYAEGFTQIDTDKRVGVYSTVTPLPVIKSSPVCRNYTSAGPASAVCARALQTLPNTFGATITQNQTDSGCTPIFLDGDCQIDLCAPTGSKVTTNQVLDAIKQINSTCSHLPPGGSQAAEMGGYLHLANSNGTLSISANSMPRNMWCNTSPNNSPLFNDCFTAYNNINTSTIFYQRGVSQGCTLLASSGTCKINFCSPLGDTITGQQLKNAAASIMLGTCLSDKYVSGIYQINQYASVGIYDPPDQDMFGDIKCTNSDSHPDFSPLESDCNTLAEKWVERPGSYDCNSVIGDPSDYKACTIIDTQGTCGVAICQNKRKIGCDYLGEIIHAMAHKCFTGYKDVFYSSAQIGLRNPAFGDHQILMYNAKLQPFGPFKDKDGAPTRRALVDIDRRNRKTRRELLEADAFNREAARAHRANATLTKRDEGPPQMTELPANAYQSTSDGFYIQPVLGRGPNGLPIDNLDEADSMLHLDVHYDGTQQWVGTMDDVDNLVAQVQINTEGETSMNDAGFTNQVVQQLGISAFDIRDGLDPRSGGQITFPGQMPQPTFFVANIIRRIPSAGDALYAVIGQLLIYSVFTAGISGPSS